MRLAVVLLVALLNTADPWLCCCVLAAMTAAPAQAAETTPVACPHCPPPAQPDTPKPAQPVPPCPCLARMAATVPALPPEAVADPFATAPDWAVWVEPVSVPTAVRAAPEAVSGLPFLTAETRLRVHHVLLC